MKWENAKNIIKENNFVKKALQDNEEEYKIIREIIHMRRERNMTQKELAELIGTRQSNISRLESGNYNPTIAFLKKVAEALGKHLEIRMN